MKMCLIENDERVLDRAFAYIHENNLYSEFLQSQGVKVPPGRRARDVFLDFLENHVGDRYAHLYVTFVKEHKKRVITDKSKVITDKSI